MLGIIGAMEVEVKELREMMENPQAQTVAGMTFYQGKIKGKDVVVVRSGIGKVNAGICSQILVDRYNVEGIINTGIAGSLDAQIDIGDMVVSTDCVEHDVDASIFGDPVGQVPRMDTFSFPADPILVGKEGFSWERLLNEAFPKFIEGTFDEEYQAQMIREFESNLGV